jgi:hypothetical protein
MQINSLNELLPILHHLEKLETKSFVDNLINFNIKTRGICVHSCEKYICLKLDQFSEQDWKIFSLALSNLDSLQLRVLKLNVSFMSEEKMIQILKKCQFLESLDMGGKQFNHSNNLLKIIGSYCKNLEYLNLSHSKNLNEEGIAYLKSCLKLRELNLSFCPLVSPQALNDLLANCGRSLETLILFQNSQLTSDVMREISLYSKELRYLNVGGCRKISSSSIQKVLESCPHLHSIFLELLLIEIDQIFLKEVYPNLENLSLKNTNLTSEGFLLLAKKLPNLKRLDLEGCGLIPIQRLVEGVKDLSKLTMLNLKSCAVSEKDVQVLRAFSQNLIILYDY